MRQIQRLQAQQRYNQRSCKLLNKSISQAVYPNLYRTLC